jgi:5-formyltetrahydrofolate cyclo-ligase
MKDKRKTMLPEDVREHSALVCAQILSLSQYADAKHVLLYFPIRNEVDVTPVLEDAFIKGKKVYLPVIRQENRMEACEYNEFDMLIKNEFNILEPMGSDVIAPEKLDFIIVPGVAFDRRLYRIGFGAGYYDRYLPLAVNAYKAGAAYAFQIVELIEEENHDVCLDALVTERDILYRV